jgi:hypothetical protein
MNKFIVYLITMVSILNLTAATYYVDANKADDSGDGTSWSTAKKSIQAGVDLTSAEDIVVVTNGTYDTGGTTTERVNISNEITVRSVNGQDFTTITGATDVRVAWMTAGTLDGFTITGGDAADGLGGGVYCNEGGTVVNCNIHNNIGTYGCGLYLVGSCLINKCIISNHTTRFQGAGIHITGTNAIVNNIIVNNCLIKNCSATARKGTGAAIYFYGTGSINNCTIVSNTVESTGYSIIQLHEGTMNNCIVWGNTGINIIKGDGIIRNTCSPDGVTVGVNGCITSDPQFTDSTNGDYSVKRSSPCINTGDNTYAPSGTDLDGDPRILSRIVDMGAYEKLLKGTIFPWR